MALTAEALMVIPVLPVTVVEAVDVQPLAGSVTVTVYVPVALTVLVAPVPTPLQAKVAEPAVLVAVKVTLFTPQLSDAGVCMPPLGALVF